jgi:predicted permease
MPLGSESRTRSSNRSILEVAANALSVRWDLLRADVRYTVRTFVRTPGFVLTAIAVTALGIGATTAAFSVTDFVLIRPLPFPEPDRLVKVWETTPGYRQMELSAPNYRDYKAAGRSFESMGTYHFDEKTMLTGVEPRRIRGSAVSADLFPTLGVTPLIGRSFTVEDDRKDAAGTVMLSYRFWQTEFGGDRSILGRPIVLDDEPYTVIGVMPADFHFPSSEHLIWTPTRFGEGDYVVDERTNNWLEAVGRLRHGITMQQARAELDRIAADLRERYPKENKDTGASAFPLGAEISDRSRLLLFALSGAAGCVLLIACANLANLLLARVVSRRREMAVRIAIGAGPERLVGQLMTESLLLAAIGGALGVGLAFAAVPLLAQLVPPRLPIAASPAVDLRVLTFAVALTAGTGLLFGLAPVLRVARGRDLDALRESARVGGGSKDRVRSLLVVAEVAASVILLVSAGLLIRALVAVQHVDPGFKAEGVLTLRTELPDQKYGSVPAREAFYSRVLQHVRALPGVTSAAYVSFVPMSSFRGGIWPVSFKGDATNAEGIRSAENVACLRYVTPESFATLGVPLKRGRDISRSDTRDGQYVAVVSESFVRRYWPGQDPIGRHFNFAFADREIVGVVGDVRFRGLERSSEPQVYLSAQQVDDGSITWYTPRSLVVKTRVEPTTLAAPVREAIRRADPTLPITEVQPMTRLIELETASRSIQLRVLGAFAVIAVFLAAVGIHGVLAFLVSQRSQEIGVRIALGARGADILGMVLGRGVVLAVSGIVPGVLVAYVAGRSMQALLAGVPPGDPLTYAAVSVLAVVMTVAGTLVPAIRAVRVDPISVIRAE